jgi:hypothetical protein
MYAVKLSPNLSLEPKQPHQEREMVNNVGQHLQRLMKKPLALLRQTLAYHPYQICENRAYYTNVMRHVMPEVETI